MEISYHYEVLSVTELTVYISCLKDFFCMDSIHLNIKKEISFHWQVCCFFFSQNERMNFTLQDYKF